MPLYEYFCSQCEAKFELLRPLSRMDDAAACPEGHEGAERVLSVFAAFSSSEGDLSTAPGGSGGCPACAGGRCTCSGH